MQLAVRHPEKVKSRKALLSKLRPLDLFPDADEEPQELEDVEDSEAEEVDV